jgi:hypothetical protein
MGASMNEFRPHRFAWDEPRRARLKELWADNDRSVPEIAGELQTSAGAIYLKAREMELAPRRKGRKRRERPATSGDHHRKVNGQRRFAGIEATGESRIVLPGHHPAAREGSTIFPRSVVPAGELPRLLKSGMNSRKIGGIVTKGRYRGLPIYTLTLEERETCPRTCEQWLSCYGNNMHWAQRVHDDGTLIRRLWAELAVLNAEHLRGFLVRLHVLGDFYSLEYVDLWRRAMADFPRLVVFGFTARRPPDPIGIAVAELCRDHYDRFRMRFSGLRMEQDGAIVVDRHEDAIGVLCPAEKDQERCCGSCGLCWHSNVTISFLRH